MHTGQRKETDLLSVSLPQTGQHGGKRRSNNAVHKVINAFMIGPKETGHN
jgi:hypothetical protein